MVEDQNDVYTILNNQIWKYIFFVHAEDKIFSPSLINLTNANK
jgi:hypothetical protein